MSTYVIFDSTASLVDSYEDEAKACAALEEIARQDPGAADDYALFECDEDGVPRGKALVASELHVAA